jgi:tetratricopeptide (TPR) repeat protein
VADLLDLPTAADQLFVARGAERTVWFEALQYGSLGRDGRPQLVGEVDDLTVFGVRRADADPRIIADLGYVQRPVDEVLDRVMREAVRTHRMVLVVGDSAAGKSRCAVEAVRRQPALRQRPLLVPEPERQGTERLLDSGAPIDDTIVWLDDLDRHLSHGLSADLLGRLHGGHSSTLCVATIRRERMANLQQAGGQLWEILTDPGVVARVDVPAEWSSDDQSAVAQRTDEPDLLTALSGGVGLGEWLIAGRELMEKLRLGQAVERAVASAVVGWARIGLHLPLPADTAAQLWTDYLSAADRTRVEPLDERGRAGYYDPAVQWLCSPVLGRPLHEQQLAYQYTDGFVAHDYVVDQVGRDPHRPKISDRTWDLALRIAWARATGGETAVDAFFAIGMAALADDAFAPACTAFRTLHKINYPMAGAMLAGLLLEHRLAQEAIQICDEVVDRLAGDPDPWRRRTVAHALSVKAAALWQVNQREAALAVWEELSEAFGADPAPRLRASTANALLQTCRALAEQGSDGEAMAVARDLISRYGEDTHPDLAPKVAGAMVELGVLLRKQGESDQAVLQEHTLIDRFGSSDNPEVRRAVAKAAGNVGLDLAKDARQRPDPAECRAGAIAALEGVISRFGEDRDREVREQVAKAAYSLGVVLLDAGQPEPAAARFRTTIDDFSADDRPAVREYAARSMLRLAVAQAEDGDVDAARRTVADLDVRFGQKPTPALAAVLAEGGRLVQAIS